MHRRFMRIGTFSLLMAGVAAAQGLNNCGNLPNYPALKAALTAAITAETSGLNLNMWGTIVDRDGVVCAVAFTGADRQTQWPGSRIISAQKANTANSFSLDASAKGPVPGKGAALALSTANLFSAVQSGGSLFGLQESNPVDTSAAYRGSPANYGQPNDPLVGSRVGGVNVFGGGLALYDANHTIIGAVGVSGDTSCADHFIAWRTRHNLNLDHLGTVIGGVSGDPDRPDNIIFDIAANSDGTGATGQDPTKAGGVGTSPSGFGHPKCINTGDPSKLPAVQP